MSSSTDRGPLRSRASLALFGLLALCGTARATPEHAHWLADLARTRAPYLVLDPSTATLEVHVSGYRFASHALLHAELAALDTTCLPEGVASGTYQELLLQVTEDVAAEHRPTVAPARLDQASDLAKAPPGPATGSAPAASLPTPPPAAPSSYVVGLDANWRLVVGHRPPTAWSRWAEAVAAGWKSLWGQPPTGCELRITLSPQEARSLRDRARPGTRIAVLLPAPRPAP